MISFSSIEYVCDEYDESQGGYLRGIRILLYFATCNKVEISPQQHSMLADDELWK